jgi:hypothetical protein
VKSSTTHYYCDNCDVELPTHTNEVCIVTSKSEQSIGWSRLRVKIEHRHGSHNDAKSEPSELCQNCAYLLLKDAAERVKAGERASAGVESSSMEKFVEVKKER